MHIFFAMADGSCVAFFEVPEAPPAIKDTNTPAWVQHLALVVEDEDELEKPIKSETLEDGTRLEQWTFRRDRLDEEGALISRYILTTVGRVVMNHTIIDAVAAA